MWYAIKLGNLECLSRYRHTRTLALGGSNLWHTPTRSTPGPSYTASQYRVGDGAEFLQDKPLVHTTQEYRRAARP
jgi:hypothetical protein